MQVILMLSIMLKYWMELLMTTLVSAIIYAFKQYCSLKGGMRSLLRMKIVRIYETYMNLGYCPSYMKEKLLNAIINLLKVKSIITLLIFGAFFILSIKGVIDTDNFMLILGMIATYFFNKEQKSDNSENFKN